MCINSDSDNPLDKEIYKLVITDLARRDKHPLGLNKEELIEYKKELLEALDREIYKWNFIEQKWLLTPPWIIKKDNEEGEI